MKKIILLMTALLSSTSVYAICTPTGVNIEKCECAHPIIENGILTCGPTYCPTGTTCMPLGNCCQTEKVCGSSSTECCKDDEVCVNKTTCCPAEKPYLDTNGNCVECTTNEHCMQTTDSCGICSNGTCVSSDSKCPETMYCDANFACMCDVGYTTCSDSECCSSSQTCVNGTKCCSTETPYLDTNGNCVQCTDDSHCSEDGETCDTATGTCEAYKEESTTCTSDSECISGACNLGTNKCCPGEKTENTAYFFSYYDGECTLQGSWSTITGIVFACRQEGEEEKMKVFCSEKGYTLDSFGANQLCPFICYAKEE